MQLLILLLFSTNVDTAISQVPAEDLFEQEGEESDASEVVEIIAELRAHPLDLNEASVTELQQVPWISRVLAAKIVALRRQQGAFKALEELLELEGVSAELLQILSEFIVVERLKSERMLGIEVRCRGSGKLESSRGYESGIYADSPIKSYLRVRANWGSFIQVGGLIEKDAGESRVDDYRGMFCAVQASSLRTRFFLGDYQMEYGQGLVFWSAYGFAKGAEAILPVVSRPRGLRPYTSVNESAGLRGLAVESNLGWATVTAFVSDRTLDGTLQPAGQVSALYESGLHRSGVEQAKKGAVGEQLAGGHVWLTPLEWIRAGVTYYSSRFDKTLCSIDSTRRRFDFRGERNEVAGADIDMLLSNLHIFGEAARSKSGGHAAALGMHLDFRHLDLVLHLRDYGRDYYNFHAFAFAHSGGTVNNERGVYVGMSWKLDANTRLSAYYDFFKHSWRTYTMPLPGSGEEGLVEIGRKLGTPLKLTFRARYKQIPYLCETIDSFGRILSVAGRQQKLTLRMQVDFRANRTLGLRGRLEKSLVKTAALGATSVSAETSSGMLLYQDVRVRLAEYLTGHIRLLYFDSEDYDARLYAYENDLLGVLTNRAFSGRGTHWFLLLRCRLFQNMTLGFKFTSTYYDDRTTVGSGYDETEGPVARTLALQLDVNL